MDDFLRHLCRKRPVPFVVLVSRPPAGNRRRRTGDPKMIRTTLTILLASAVAMLAAPGSANAQEGSAAVQATSVPTKKGHVEANGVSYYYEIHGKGEPLVLLHGGLGSIHMFAPGMPILAEGRGG